MHLQTSNIDSVNSGADKPRESMARTLKLGKSVRKSLYVLSKPDVPVGVMICQSLLRDKTRIHILQPLIRIILEFVLFPKRAGLNRDDESINFDQNLYNFKIIIDLNIYGICILSIKKETEFFY